jgi:hypothetical protein
MSLYTSTYTYIIKTLATSIYNKIQSRIINTTQNAQFWSRSITLSDFKRGSTDTITSKGVVTSVYTKPTATSIERDIKTFIKNTLNFSDTTFNQYPDGNDMLAFIFALNYFLENSLSKVAINLTTTTIIYSPVTEGFTNNVTLFDNMIDTDVINGMYKTLQKVGANNNTARRLTINGTMSSSCCSSSCSSSSSSSSSSSCSSSSMFVAYFNI